MVEGGGATKGKAADALMPTLPLSSWALRNLLLTVVGI